LSEGWGTEKFWTSGLKREVLGMALDGTYSQ
jgi:hypothetical protein